MNDEDKKDILLLENFIKKTKSDKIQIKQPLKIVYHDIFNNDDKDSTIEKKSLKSKDILRAKRTNLTKTKKYNIIKESIVFQELDSKKSIINISNAKDEYNNFLYNNLMKNSIINSNQEKLYTKKWTEFMRRKSTVNFNELYEMKLKNVRNIYILI
jgi:hypothetical protein